MIDFRILTPLLLLPALVSFAVPAAAQESAMAGQEGVEASSVGASMGIRRLAPGRWGMVKVEVYNTSEQDGSVEAEVFFRGYGEQRFAREVWVPARGTRTSWIPVHVPADASGGALEVVGRSGGRADPSKQSVTPIPLVSNPLTVAFLTDSPAETPAGEQTEDPAYEAVLAMRGARGLDRNLAMVHDHLLPPTFEGWNVIDYAVVAGDRLADDSAGQVAMRQWIAAGGRVWLQLNRMSPDTARRLLGDAFRVEVVDRVPLTRFRVSGPGVEESAPEREFEEPVELIRAFVEGAEIMHEVDGWPASFVIPFGYGEVIVTTLDAHGWMRLRGPDDPQFSDPLVYTKYMATDPMRRLTDRLFRSDPPPALPASLQGDYLTERIGYRIPDRGVVLMILLGFCGSIGVFGGILIRRQRLEHLAWLTILAALLSAGSVVGMGWTGRQAVPPTVAQAQLVRVIPQTGDYVASGMIARFEPDQKPVSLQSFSGWRIDPTMPDLAGQIRRFVWTDLNEWHWRGTDLPPGVRMLSTHATGPLSAPVQAVGRFGSDGFSGRLDAGPFTAASDALVAAPFAPPLAANLRTDGSFRAAPNDLLADGQFLSDALLSEEQRRRQEMYAAWFAARRESESPQVPMLMAWAEPIAGAFEWPDGVQQTGATLLSVPLTIERTPPDTPVTIPSSMLDVRAVVGPQGQSRAFDNKTRSWISPNTQASTTRLRFQMPAAVLPMNVSRATFTMECNVPSRAVELFAVSGASRRSLARRSNPSGVVSITIDEAELLRLDERGGLLIDIEVGPMSGEVGEQTLANSGWTISSTRLEVAGRTLPAAGAPAATEPVAARAAEPTQ